MKSLNPSLLDLLSTNYYNIVHNITMENESPERNTILPNLNRSTNSTNLQTKNQLTSSRNYSPQGDFIPKIEMAITFRQKAQPKRNYFEIRENNQRGRIFLNSKRSIK